MGVKLEKKITERLLAMVKETEPIPKSIIWSGRTCYLWSGVFLLLYFILLDKEKMGDLSSFLLPLISGTLFGIGLYNSISQRNWPYFKKHLNKESMERRLNEPET